MQALAGKRGKKIVHVTSVHKPDDTRIYQRQVKSLAGDGYEVILIAPAPDTPPVLDDPRVKVILVNKFAGKLARLFVTGPTVTIMAARTRADIHHFHDPELIPWMLLLQIFGKHVVMDLHENYPAQVMGMTWIPAFVRKPIANLAKVLVNLGVALFAGTVVADEELKKPYEAKVDEERFAVVSNYPILDETLLAASFEPERYAKPHILFLGGVNKHRVAAEFVTALDELRDMKFDVTLGGNINEEPLPLELTKKKVWSRIRYIGRIPSRQITARTLDATISINLYSNMPNHHDIRSNRLFEAMAAGLAVVVSDFPKWRSFIIEHRCGIAVDPHDPLDIAQGLKSLFVDPNLCREMGIRGRAAVLAKYNWKAQYSALKALYARIGHQLNSKRNVVETP